MRENSRGRIWMETEAEGLQSRSWCSDSLILRFVCILVLNQRERRETLSSSLPLFNSEPQTVRLLLLHPLKHPSLLRWLEDHHLR